MKVFRASANVPLPESLLSGSAVTIGNFDGCHRGHQELIRLTLKMSAEKQLSSVALTFDPNPKQYFQPQRKFGRLFKTEQKIRALAELGIEVLVIQNFDADFSRLSPQAFYETLLHDKLNAKVIVVGQDFCFGAQREGNVEVLRRLAAAHGAEVFEVAPLNSDGQVISSSNIRQLLQEKELDRANQLLQRPYLIEGVVIQGKKLGRTLGFPTANLDCGEQMLPGIGVYAGFALTGRPSPIFQLDPTVVPCILNIGLRPTVEDQSLVPRVEVHLLEGNYPSESLYGQSMSVSLTDFIRDERKFSSIEALKEQIGVDCEEARQRLKKSRTRSWPSVV